MDERPAQRQAYITRLDLFDDIILAEKIAVVIDLYLVVEIKCCVGVVVGIQGKLFPDFARHIHLNVHIKIEDRLSLLADSQDRIEQLLVAHAKRQVYPPLRANINGITAKEAINQAIFDINSCEWIFESHTAAATAAGKQLEILLLILLSAILKILLERHGSRAAEESFADTLPDQVLIIVDIILHRLLNRSRIIEIDRIGVGIVEKIPLPVTQWRQRVGHRQWLSRQRSCRCQRIKHIGRKSVGRPQNGRHHNCCRRQREA